MTPGRGVLYVATGAAHVAAAAASARSVRRSNPGLAIALHSDASPGDPAFDHVLPIADPHARAKVDCLAHTPFDLTLYLDTDTRVLGGLDDAFRLLERFSLAAAHRIPDPAKLAQRSGAGLPPGAFPEHNTGVLLLRRDPAVAAFLESWRAAYRARGKTADQVTFREALWASEVRFTVLPRRFNTRRYSWLDAALWRGPRPVILHTNRFHPTKRGRGPAGLLRRLEGPPA